MGGEKGLLSKRKDEGEEESYREKQGCHTVGRIKDEAVGEIMDGVHER